MKNILFSALALLTCTLYAPCAQAQTAADEAAIKTFWAETWQAYDAGNVEQMWAAYTDNAEEITPDGNLAIGKQAMRDSWDQFMKMVDTPPSFTNSNLTVRLITADVAILTWDTAADIKIGGQQIGGPTKCMGVVRKINGKWKIEADAMTPVMQMPEGN
jgi:uncharacterized protein (TIGR02246 family)